MLRSIFTVFAASAAFALAACDNNDPLGLYPEPAREAQAPLELTRRVVDAANLLTEDFERELTVDLARVEEDTLAQFVVVTTPDLQGYSIADYSLMLGRGWGIGDEGRNDGLLLVVAPNERKVRIEVGYGLENKVEDPEAAEIIRAMMPFFEQGDFPGAIDRGLELLEAELTDLQLKDAA